MLPGLRFIAATIILSTSILIFGFGAAALLRANHEEFATLKAIRTAQLPIFAQTADREAPTITLMQIEPVVEPRAAQDIGLTASENAKLASIDPQGTVETKAVAPDTPRAQRTKRRVKRVVRRRRVIVQSTTQQQSPSSSGFFGASSGNTNTN